MLVDRNKPEAISKCREMLEDYIAHNPVSIWMLARQIGLHVMTIERFLDGRDVKMPTLCKIMKFLEQ